MGTAKGARDEPLTTVISTQSADDHAVLSELVDYGKQVMAGIIKDPTFSAHVFEVPADAEPVEAELSYVPATITFGEHCRPQ